LVGRGNYLGQGDPGEEKKTRKNHTRGSGRRDAPGGGTQLAPGRPANGVVGGRKKGDRLPGNRLAKAGTKTHQPRGGQGGHQNITLAKSKARHV